MNYNSIINSKIYSSYNNLEKFNFKNNIYSSVKPDKSILINKDIDNYFNNIINIPEQPKTYKIANKSSISTFYKDYLENNMLLLFVIFIIIIFLVIRYYTKDIENDYLNNNIKFKKNILYKKKYNNEKNNLKKYKQKLNSEKNKLLSIIDELSNVNYEINSMKNNIIQQTNISNNNSNLDTNLLDLGNNKIEKELENFNNIISRDKLKDNLINDISNKFDLLQNNKPSKSYYNINKEFNDDNNLVEGMYIEPPYL